jgi:hypothetical protein
LGPVDNAFKAALEPVRVEVRRDYYYIDDAFSGIAEKVSCGGHSTDTADAASASADTTSAGSDGEAENEQQNDQQNDVGLLTSPPWDSGKVFSIVSAARTT